MSIMYAAAGGGGDVLAALMLHEAEVGGESPAVVATYAWDRLLVDPLPGPRGVDAFTGLRQVAAHTFLVEGSTRPVPPAGSTLPRLAADLPTSLILLDPYRGARGLRTQLSEAIEVFGVDQLVLVDVGGDIAARGDEAGLKSPLADLLLLTASTCLDVSVRVAVAGVGLDGELPADYVRARLESAGGGHALTLAPQHVAVLGDVFSWHPSEASGILVAAASGVRGQVEVRDGGMAIQVNDRCAEVWTTTATELAAGGLLAPQLVGSNSLDDVEATVRMVCGFSEIDIEREKAERLAGRRRVPLSVDELDARVREFRTACRARGSDLVTFRRLAESVRLPAEDYEWMRAYLAADPIRQPYLPLYGVGEPV